MFHQTKNATLTSIREMLAVVSSLKHKDDGWIDKMRAEVDRDEKSFNDLLDAKEREL